MTDKMILMPETLTAENGAKAALIGEFYETFEHECQECEGGGLGPACPHAQGESQCETCNGTGTLFERVPVEWTTIKEIYKRAVELLGKPQDEAIAEAVAAERETKERAVRDVLHTAMQRFEIETVFRVIEDRLKTERTFLSPEYTLVCKGFADNLKSDFEAIRSAAK